MLGHPERAQDPAPRVGLRVPGRGPRTQVHMHCAPPPATPPREPGPTNEPTRLETQMAELEEQAEQIENQMADATAAHKRLLGEAREAERERESPPATSIKPGPGSAPL